MYKGKHILVVTGGYNEEGKIGKVISNIPSFIDEVVAIDDGSEDNTFLEAKKSGAFVLRNKKNKGVGCVIKKGINYALKKKYDIVVLIPGDGQDNPDEILNLIIPLIKGYELVLGSRYLSKHKAPLFRIFTTKTYTFFFNLIMKTKLTDISNGFRAFDIRILNKINITNTLDRYDFEPYFLIEAIKKKIRIKEVSVNKQYDKKKGYSKMRPFIDWFNITKPIFRELLK